MLRVLIVKEIREIVYSTKFVLTFGAMSVLILLSFYTGALNYHHARQEAEASAAQLAQNLVNRTSWSGVAVNTYLAPEPLEAVVTGLVNDISRRRSVTIQMIAPGETSRYSEEPIWAMFRAIDLEFILTIVLSLFAIVFAYDSVSGERERGTLSLAMSNPLPRDTLLLGKIIGTFTALFVPLLVPLLLGAILLPVLDVPMEGDDWLRFVLIIGAGGLYLSIFLVLSTLVSSLVSRSSNSFLVLAIAWVVIVLVIPRVSIFAAGRAVEVPSKASLDYESQRSFQELFKADRDKLDAFSRSIDWSTMKREEYQAAWDKFFGDLLADQNRAHGEYMDRLLEDAKNRKRDREHLALMIARLSPAVSMRIIATTLSDSGTELEFEYEDGLLAYRNAYRSFVVGIEGNAAFSGMRQTPIGPEAKFIDPSQMPRFVTSRRDLKSVLAACLTDFGILGLFGVLLFAFSIAAFRRSDLRQPPG